MAAPINPAAKIALVGVAMGSLLLGVVVAETPASAETVTQTFTYNNGTQQTLTVPVGVEVAKITAVGGGGGSSAGAAGGAGAVLVAYVSVTPGEDLVVRVGGYGAGTPTAGGFGGSATVVLGEDLRKLVIAGAGGGAGPLNKGGSSGSFGNNGLGGNQGGRGGFVAGGRGGDGEVASTGGAGGPSVPFPGQSMNGLPGTAGSTAGGGGGGSSFANGGDASFVIDATTPGGEYAFFGRNNFASTTSSTGAGGGGAGFGAGGGGYGNAGGGGGGYGGGGGGGGSYAAEQPVGSPVESYGTAPLVVNGVSYGSGGLPDAVQANRAGEDGYVEIQYDTPDPEPGPTPVVTPGVVSGLKVAGKAKAKTRKSHWSAASGAVNHYHVIVTQKGKKKWSKKHLVSKNVSALQVKLTKKQLFNAARKKNKFTGSKATFVVHVRAANSAGFSPYRVKAFKAHK